ncbi:hypothetical protein WDV06_00075 [Streptomyces racemochromogenes]|uniref:Uncharacterized protein n=1 Tax=Streptomyces racemochromogenes TaxID=67353 RepID=A0ABW7P5V7_9ACTN
MRKARTVRTLSAIALASTLAVAGGAATTAFAAGAPSPSPSTSAPAAKASVTVPSSPVKPGDAVSVTVTAPAGSKNLTVSSAALGPVTLAPGKDGTTWTGTATVAAVKDGGHGVTLTGSGPDGAALRAAAELTVTTGSPKPKPTPASSTLRLSTDFGRPGDKVVITVRSSEREAYAKSAAFTGGRVDLKGDGKGTFTGTATVANDVKTGSYGVEAFAGGRAFDTVKFSVEAKAAPGVKPVKPLTPGEHKTPKGSVNTGQAPADA